jgi:hypothetical protein
VGFGAALGSLDVSLAAIIWSYADHRRSGEDYFGQRSHVVNLYILEF